MQGERIDRREKSKGRALKGRKGVGEVNKKRKEITRKGI
jgi:hypothetical protein